jgi:hypothetical protein
MDGPRLSRISIKPEGFYFIARIPNNKMKQKKWKKNSEYCSNFENKERVKMAHPGFPVLSILSSCTTYPITPQSENNALASQIKKFKTVL